MAVVVILFVLFGSPMAEALPNPIGPLAFSHSVGAIAVVTSGVVLYMGYAKRR